LARKGVKNKNALMYLPNFVAKYNNVAASSIRKEIVDAGIASEASMQTLCMGLYRPSEAVVGWFESKYPEATAKYFELSKNVAFSKRDFDKEAQARAAERVNQQQLRMDIAENCKNKIIEFFEK